MFTLSPYIEQKWFIKLMFFFSFLGSFELRRPRTCRMVLSARGIDHSITVLIYRCCVDYGQHCNGLSN